MWSGQRLFQDTSIGRSRIWLLDARFGHLGLLVCLFTSPRVSNLCGLRTAPILMPPGWELACGPNNGPTNGRERLVAPGGSLPPPEPFQYGYFLVFWITPSRLPFEFRKAEGIVPPREGDNTADTLERAAADPFQKAG